jgi:beta-lactamase regulating signal transducer with metallopeptidase domain
MSVSGGSAAVLLFALKPFVRDRLPKPALYYIWLVVIAALLIPVSKLIAFPIGFNPVYSLKALDKPAVPLTTDDALGAAYHAIGDALNGGLGTITVTPIGETRTTELFHSQVWFALGGKVWGFGFAGVLLYCLIGYALFAKKLRLGNINAAAEETATLSEICGGKRAPLLYRNPLAATPMLIGMLRPAIILPDREYTEAQLRAVLLHELTHMRRGDVYVKWLSLFACAVHWFNPIMWLTRREIDRACELACDEAVIRNLDTYGKQNYGDTLLYVAADFKTPRAIVATTMCEEKKALKERLGAIMINKKHTRLAVALSVALILSLSGITVTLGAGRTKTVNTSQIASDYDGMINPELTLDDVRALAAKGGALTSKDLPSLRPSFLSSFYGGYNPTLYSVEGGYRLLISFNDTTNPESGINSVSLESVWENGGSGIDIRYNDVDEFINAHPSSPGITDEEALEIARETTGRDVILINMEWWEYADEFPHESDDPEKRRLGVSLRAIAQPIILLIDTDGNYLAVGKRDGTVYAYDGGSWSAVADTSFTLSADPDADALSTEMRSLVKSLQQDIKPYEHLGVSVDSVTGLVIYDGHPVREIWDGATGSIITESIGLRGFTGRTVYEPVDLTVIYEDGAAVSFNVSTREEYDARTAERSRAVIVSAEEALAEK